MVAPLQLVAGDLLQSQASDGRFLIRSSRFPYIGIFTESLS
jgi:hypothetical protein